MRIVVTGGAGFIGSEYVRTIVRGDVPTLADAQIVVFDQLTYAGNLANLAPVADSPRYEFFHGDICSAADLDAVLPGADVVVNFAAETHVDRSIADAAGFIATNVLGAGTVFDACVRHRVGRVVHVSTDEVYGSIETGSWTEDEVLAPNSPYAAAKAGGDLIARAYARTYGLNVSVTRGSNSYGPYQYPEKIVPLFLTNLLDDRPVPLYGTGANVRDWLHVSDHCRGIQIVLEHGAAGEMYNVGGGRELSNRELTEHLLEATGRDWSSVAEVTDPRGGAHDQRYAVDYAKVAALGYAPSISFDDGLARTARWYREHRDWWEPLTDKLRVATVPAVGDKSSGARADPALSFDGAN